MARSGPPAYAWDWLARQRLPWREARARLAGRDDPIGARYRTVDDRQSVVALLRADYPAEPLVRQVVDEVVAELVFLGRTDVPFADLGLRSAPRGLRWWWTVVGGDEPDHPVRPPAPDHRQLSLDDLAADDLQRAMEQVHEGYGDP